MLKTSEILLKYPTFQGNFFIFSWAKQIQRVSALVPCRVRTKKLIISESMINIKVRKKVNFGFKSYLWVNKGDVVWIITYA